MSWYREACFISGRHLLIRARIQCTVYIMKGYGVLYIELIHVHASKLRYHTHGTLQHCMQLVFPNFSLLASSSLSSPDSLVGDTLRLLLSWQREDWIELSLSLGVQRLVVLVVCLSLWLGAGVTAPNCRKDWMTASWYWECLLSSKSEFLSFLLGSFIAACMLFLLACCSRRLWSWPLLSCDCLPRNTLVGFFEHRPLLVFFSPQVFGILVTGNT